jgi:hypothetical protein
VESVVECDRDVIPRAARADRSRGYNLAVNDGGCSQRWQVVLGEMRPQHRVE